MKRRIATVLALAFALLTPVADAEAADETIERTLPFRAGSLLEVSNTNGSIEISAWDRAEVEIEAEKKVRVRGAGSAAEALEALQVIIEETTDGVRIDTEYPRRGVDGWLRGASFSVDYRIRVPRQADLRVETVNGKVEIEGIHGQLDLASTNGGIRVEDSGGRVDAHTTNGGIDVELRQVVDGEDMTFRSTNGGVTLALPDDVGFDLEARTTNGGINIDFPVTVQGEISRRRLQGVINGGGGLIRLKTTNGGIRIREI